MVIVFFSWPGLLSVFYKTSGADIELQTNDLHLPTTLIYGVRKHAFVFGNASNLSASTRQSRQIWILVLAHWHGEKNVTVQVVWSMNELAVPCPGTMHQEVYHS
jgi:hypothetical protein